MNRKGQIIFFLIFCFASLVKNVFSQSPGNSWINYSQKYLKVPVAKTGIYRLEYSKLSTGLAAINIDIASIDPRKFIFFHKGDSIPVFISGEQDGSFDAIDYIEFYGEKNDGWLDAGVYVNPEDQGNPYYSLFNDTAWYYVTWNSSLNHPRLNLSSNTTFTGFSPEAFVYREEVKSFNDVYHNGETNPYGGTDPEYTAGEGWMGSVINANQTFSADFPTSSIYKGGPTANIEVYALGGNNNTRTHTFKWNGNLLYDKLTNGYKSYKLTGDFSTNIIFASNTLTMLSTSAQTDRSALSYIKIKFPQDPDFDNKGFGNFKLPKIASGNERLIKFKNQLSEIYYIFDLTGKRKIITAAYSGGIAALIPTIINQEQQCYFVSENSIIKPVEIYPVSPSGNFINYSVSPGSNSFLIITHKSLITAAKDYADYRSTLSGGGYNCIIIDESELYDQFAYGIRKHPLGIRNFLKYISTSWATLPGHLLLLGKSRYAASTRTNSSQNLVPSWGNPPSDNLISSRIGGVSYFPLIPTGRVSAQNVQQVVDYLNKVKDLESQEQAEWMKNVLHFGGGNGAMEQSILKGYLENYRKIIEDTSFGGYVKSIYKTNPDVIDYSQSSTVVEMVDSGSSIMNFFGHAAGSSFDISLGNIQTYNNKGKYPVIIANSCYSGDIHGAGTSNNEDFVLTPDKGVIGFIAQVSQGLPSALNLYTGEWYKQIGQKNYGKSIGNCIRGTLETIGTDDPYVKATCLEMTLHGDPAIKINSFPKPDYFVNNTSVFFDPENIYAETDSFLIKIIVTNIGKATHKPVEVEVRRTFPDNTDTVFFSTLPEILFKDTFILKIPVDQNRAIGLNRFDINVDPSNIIPETDDVINNRVSSQVNIKSSSLVPVYPYKFAVVPSNDLTLKASTGDPLAPVKNYIFQIDTTDLFNSPSMKSNIVTNAGGVVKWPSAVLQMGASVYEQDSMVYFWRTSPDSATNGKYIWKESSFQIIKEKRGWGQAHHFQMEENEFKLITHNRSPRDFTFDMAPKPLQANVQGNSTSYTTEYLIESKLQDYAGCGGTPAIHIAVIDPITLEPWGTRKPDPTNPAVILNPDHEFGNANAGCRPWRVEYYFAYYHDSTQMNSLLDLLKNKIPNGYYILAYSYVSPKLDLFPSALISEFITLGSDSISYIRDNFKDCPYLFFCKKGDPTTALEVYGKTPNAYISLNTKLYSNWSAGRINSTIIGPAKQWKSFHWNPYSIEPGSDSSVVSIYGLTNNGSSKLLYRNIFSGNKDVLNLNDSINAETYPFLKLDMLTRDETKKTPAQLRNWQVLYDDVPEAAVNPGLYYNTYYDSLQQGDPLNFAVAVENISDLPMDSVLIRFSVRDETRNTRVEKYKRYKKLPAGDTLHSFISLPSLALNGNNDFEMEVNPINATTNKFDQLEQYHFNNFLYENYYIGKDKLNPILDVTFDNAHILDGDIVSPKPEISIRLTDENKYLVLDDTALVMVYILLPDNDVPKRIYFKSSTGEEILKWTPGSKDKNEFNIIYNPVFGKDGIYQLIIQAKDKSNNRSGDIDYRINFEVILKSTITEVLNYPNPFTTSTRFAFTLTGSEIPEEFLIQILTVSGKVIKEISREELGQLRIGRNITEYFWDGTDDFGDRLANGIYLYRVVTKINGEAIEKRATTADKFFKSGFGKMYLMR